MQLKTIMTVTTWQDSLKIHKLYQIIKTSVKFVYQHYKINQHWYSIIFCITEQKWKEKVAAITF